MCVCGSAFDLFSSDQQGGFAVMTYVGPGRLLEVTDGCGGGEVVAFVEFSQSDDCLSNIQ